MSERDGQPGERDYVMKLIDDQKEGRDYVMKWIYDQEKGIK